MATVPAPIPAAAVPKTVATPGVISAFLKAHEFLICFVVAVLLFWFVSGRVENIIAAHDKDVYDAGAAALQAQADKNATVAQQNAQLAADYRTFAQQAQQANLQLEQANAKLADALKGRQAADAALPAPDLAVHIETLAGVPAGGVVPAPGNTFAITTPAAVAIAQGLESVPTLTGELANTKAEKATVDQQLVKQGAIVAGLNNQITGLGLQITDADKACKAQVAFVKAEANKSKRKWFVIGYVAGLATRGAIKIFAGV